jgi:hypothetical protein
MKGPEKMFSHTINLYGTTVTSAEDFIYSDTLVMKNFLNFSYNMDCKNNLHPGSFDFSLQAGKGFVKAWTEINLRIPYSAPSKGIFIRFFWGKFLYQEHRYYGNYNFRLCGWTGYQDYQYEHIFPGRNEFLDKNNSGFFAHQFARTDGGFTTFTPLGQSNDWLAAVNISASLPLKVPLRIYFDAGSYAGAGEWKYSRIIPWEAGIEFTVIRNIASVYFPVFISEDIRKTSEYVLGVSYIKKIRFTLNLNRLNFFTELKDFIL